MSKTPKFQVHSTTTGSGSIAEELMGAGPATARPEPAQPAPGGAPPQPRVPAPAASQRTPIRVHIPGGLADRVRGAVAALGYKADGWSSLNAATAAALEEHVTAAERRYNDGQPFPWVRGSQLQPGRKLQQG